MNSTENLTESFSNKNNLDDSIPSIIKEIERDFNEIEVDFPKEESITNNSPNKKIPINLYFNDNNMKIFFESSKLQSLIMGNFYYYKFNLKECSLCFQKIKKYGLLSNCNDIFCYNCIQEWRKEAILKNKRELFRKCPICGIESYFLIKSNKFIYGEEKKKRIHYILNNKGNKLSKVK